MSKVPLYSTECYDCIYASFDRVTDELYCTKKRHEFSDAPNGRKRDCFVDYHGATKPVFPVLQMDNEGAIKIRLQDFDHLVQAIRELTVAVNKAAVGWSEKK